MEMNDILSIRYDFDARKEYSCVNSSGMNTILDIPYNFRLCVKFSTVLNSTRSNIGFTCTNYFRSILSGWLYLRSLMK